MVGASNQKSGGGGGRGEVGGDSLEIEKDQTRAGVIRKFYEGCGALRGRQKNGKASPGG